MRRASGPPLSHGARALRAVHNAVGVFELGCLGYLWFCAVDRRRDRWLALAEVVLIGEGLALVVAKGCPLGIFQRRAGDDLPMFELWFGARLAHFAVPTFTGIAVVGGAVLLARRPDDERDRAFTRRDPPTVSFLLEHFQAC